MILLDKFSKTKYNYIKVALSDVKTYLTSAGFTSDDPTALAIALG